MTEPNIGICCFRSDQIKGLRCRLQPVFFFCTVEAREMTGKGQLLAAYIER